MKVFAIVAYLHSQLQRFFVDVSCKMSNNRCRFTAYGNFAILLSLMQRDKILIFDVRSDINGQLRQKVKASRR